jgi:ribonuclease E
MGYGSPWRLRGICLGIAVAMFMPAPAARAGDLSAAPVAVSTTPSSVPASTDTPTAAAPETVGVAAPDAAVTRSPTAPVPQTPVRLSVKLVEPTSPLPATRERVAQALATSDAVRATPQHLAQALAVSDAAHPRSPVGQAVSASRQPAMGRVQPRRHAPATASSVDRRPLATTSRRAAARQQSAPPGLASTLPAPVADSYGAARAGLRTPSPVPAPAPAPRTVDAGDPGAAGTGGAGGNAPLVVALTFVFLALAFRRPGRRLPPAGRRPHGFLPVLLLERPG